MTDSSLPASAGVTFPVRYQHPGSATTNTLLKGEGTLTVHPAGPTYRFTGRQLGAFSSHDASITMTAAEIADVTIHGRLLRFAYLTTVPKPRRRTFVCFAASESDAQIIGGLLPATRTTEFTETNDFYTRLRSLPGATSPWSSITNLLIAANLVVFVVMATFLGAGWFEANTAPYIPYGANNGALTTHGEWWRLITSMFLHYGLVHVLLNMWALYQAGHLMERLQGRWLYLLTYFASGIAGGFASILWHQDRTLSAGASGAVFGIFGALLGFMLRQKQTIPRTIFRSMTGSTAVFAAYNILFGLAHPRIDNSAHLGGALAGVIFGWLLALPVDPDAHANLQRGRLRLGIVALIALCAAGVATTPRFTYRLDEALMLAQTNEPFDTREGELLKPLEPQLNALDTPAQRIAGAETIEQTILPHYRAWIDALAALKFDPRYDTDRDRTRLIAILEQQSAAFANLSEGLRTGDPDARERFTRESEAVRDALGNNAEP